MAKKKAKKPRRAPRQARSKFLRSALIEAASHILVECGYQKTTTQKVADRAGCSIGSLYQYFPNKQALLSAVFEEHLALSQDSFEKFTAISPGEPVDGISVAVRGIAGSFLGKSRLYRILLEEAPARFRIDAALATRRRYIQRLATAMRTQPQSTFPEGGADIVAFTIVNAISGVLQAAVFSKDIDEKKLIDQLITMVKRHLGVAF